MFLQKVVVNGTTDLTGAEVKCTDLRGGVSMILMGLNSKGETKVSDIRHVDRGYENIVSKLRGLGADITRIEE
jgi:UDP-N-acetylglucosamine 1-carboxyvinyltransferase